MRHILLVSRTGQVPQSRRLELRPAIHTRGASTRCCEQVCCYAAYQALGEILALAYYASEHKGIAHRCLGQIVLWLHCALLLWSLPRLDLRSTFYPWVERSEERRVGKE